MRIGLIARADKTGLTSLTHGFWRNMAPAATLVVDLSRLMGTTPDLDMFTGDPNVSTWQAPGFPECGVWPDRVIDSFLEQVDVVFTAETPYNFHLFAEARRRGIRTVLQPMYEFLDVRVGLPEPDVYALPTTWHEAQIRSLLPNRRIVHLPVPVDRELIPFRRRDKLRTILHTAGTAAVPDRAGTKILVEAMRRVRSPVKAVIRAHRPISAPYSMAGDRITTVFKPTRNYWELYGGADLYVQPRRFGGLNLPMQEALAAGMPTLLSDAPPQRCELPAGLLVPARPGQRLQVRNLIDTWEVSPGDLAERIDWLYEDPKALGWFSDWAGRWAIRHDWEALKPRYEAVLQGDPICASCT